MMKNDDLISRKAAIDAVLSEERYCERNMDDETTASVKMARFKLEKVPVVDAAPVVHGRWMYKERHRKSYRQYTGFDGAGEIHTIMVLEESEGKEPYCSECGAQAAESFLEYCPHCGAEMDGERRG